MKRRMKRDRIDMLRDDLDRLIQTDGDTVVFKWVEVTGGTWNETYETWEGGTETEMSHTLKGIGKVVDYAEDEMEYEYGRISVGDCIIRFPWDANFEPIMGKEGVRFIYKGQRWRVDSTIGVGDAYSDEYYSMIVKGVKSSD